MSPRSAVLVESVAQALTWAINDPTGHHSWKKSVRKNSVQTISSHHCGAEENQQTVTVFDSSAIPPIGIQKYLKRLYQNFECCDAAFIAALIVVDRVLEYNGVPLTMRNVHRIFFASLVVAVKYHEDLIYSNNHYGRAGGVHLREVNRLEFVLLLSLDFDLRVEPDQYRLYDGMLLSLCSGSPNDFLSTTVASFVACNNALVEPSQAETGSSDHAAAIATPSGAPDAVVVEAPAVAQASDVATTPVMKKTPAAVDIDAPIDGSGAVAQKQNGFMADSASTLREGKSFGKPPGGQSSKKGKGGGKRSRRGSVDTGNTGGSN